MEDKTKVYLAVAVLAVFAAWFLRYRMMGSTNQQQSLGTLLVSVNGKPAESGYVVDNNNVSSGTMWTSDKINSLLGNVINDNMYGNRTTFSSSKLKAVFDALYNKIEAMSSIDDSNTSTSKTWSSQKIMGMMNPKVYFDVIMNDSMKVTGNIVYDSFNAQSENSGMDLASGIFTCSQPGLYRFTFTGLRYYFVTAPTEARVRMVLNDKVIATTASTSAMTAPDTNPRPTGGETLNMNLMLNLNAGDKVWCRVDSGGIFDNATEHITHFTGELLKPALSPTADGRQ